MRQVVLGIPDAFSELVLIWGSCYDWHGAADVRECGAWVAGMRQFRAGWEPFSGAVAALVRPGLLALRSASGLGPPAWCGRVCPDSVQPGW